MVEPEILDEEEVTEELVEDVRIALKALEEARQRFKHAYEDLHRAISTYETFITEVFKQV